ncbi:MAG: hypothetical protein ACREBR_00480, partial [bacterium]
DHLGEEDDDEPTIDETATVAIAITIEPYKDDNLVKMLPFESFGDRSKKCSPDVLLYMHYFVATYPSLLPMIVRNLPQGSSHTEGGRAKTPKTPHIIKKRKSSSSTQPHDLQEVVLISEEERVSYATANVTSKYNQLMAMRAYRASLTDKPLKLAKLDENIDKLEDEVLGM